jgi:hypothetical protein
MQFPRKALVQVGNAAGCTSPAVDIAIQKYKVYPPGMAADISRQLVPLVATDISWALFRGDISTKHKVEA